MKQPLSVKDSITILGIAYYQKRSVKDLKAAYKRNKGDMSHKAKQSMRMMVNSKNPVFILEAGLKEVFKEDSKSDQ